MTIIAIDGTAASGKSTLARMVARELGWLYVNTGAMYRAVTWAVVREGCDPYDTAAVTRVLQHTQFEWGIRDGESTIVVNDQEPGPELSSKSVNEGVSQVACVPEVRAALVAAQRAYAEDHAVVMEGRDIGTSVFPETPYKFYVDASPEVRARRRRAEGVLDEVTSRDAVDSTRSHSPLKQSDGAIFIDTSDLNPEQTLVIAMEHLRAMNIFPGPHSFFPHS